MLLVLLLKFLELVEELGKIKKVVLVIDLCLWVFYDEIMDMLVNLDNMDFVLIWILFLDVFNEELVLCYKEMWCFYLLVMEGCVMDGVCKE